MFKFQIGDRIICNGRKISGLNIDNEPGVVIDHLNWMKEHLWPASNGYTIQFDNEDLIDDEDFGACWVVPEESLRLENESEEDKEKRRLKFLKHKHIDPFGEEIWEQYEYEDIKPKFKVGDRVICSGIEDGLDIDDCVGTISWVGLYNRHYIYTVNFDKGFSTQLDEENSWNVGEDKMRIYDTKEEEIRMKKRKDASLRNIDKDPFQEEIWESQIWKNKPFEIGDIVICRGRMSGSNVEGHIGTIVDVSNERYSRIVFDKPIRSETGKLIKNWNIFDDQIEFLNREDKEKRLEKKKELSLRHKEIDPFGEEIWEGIKKYKDFI